MEDRIVADPRICGGEACVRGTRVPVHIVLDYLGAGDTVEAIVEEFPQLEVEDVRACARYAALLAKEEIEPLELVQS